MERITCARTDCGLGRAGCQIWDEMLVFTACCVVRQESLCAVSLQADLGLAGLIHPSLIEDAFSWSLRGA